MADATGPNQVRPSAVRRAVSWAAVTVLAATAVFGANPAGLRERLVGPDAVEPATSRSADGTNATTGTDGTDRQDAAPPAGGTVLRSNPWWQRLTSTTVEADDELPFTVSDQALQWRVMWSCEQGQLELSTGPDVLVTAVCPDRGTAYGTTTGLVELHTRGGPAELVVEQQVDVPLAEPPLPGMSDAALLARGTFEAVDQSTTGEVRLYRLGDGRRVLRLEDFFVTPNVDLELRLSDVADITSSEQYLAGTSVHVADLDVTAGSMNIALPSDVDPSEFASLVVWCEPVLSAYATVDLVWED